MAMIFCYPTDHANNKAELCSFVEEAVDPLLNIEFPEWVALVKYIDGSLLNGILELVLKS
jgi:hypothetical protein